MATLAIDQPCNAASNIALRHWLNGSWAVLFSHPEHFAPNASTPKGYLTCLASILAENGIKLIELQSQARGGSWIDESDPERRLVSLATSSADVLDLHAHTLIKKIQGATRPFVMVLDQLSRCRTTLNYRPEHIARPRTLEDIVETIYVLRGDGPVVGDDSDNCEQQPNRRAKTW